jgi:transposase
MRCFRTRGKKGRPHLDPADPPRRRANKRRGRGTYANDRPPIVGVVGRNTGQVRIRVKPDTKAQTLCGHVHRCTQLGTVLYTDESDSYTPVQRPHAAVCHSRKEWARDDDGDGIREVHTNTLEGLWSGLRTFLRPFRGVHKAYLSGYVAVYEFWVNLKRSSVALIAALVRCG